jgi:hypothetical protein
MVFKSRSCRKGVTPARDSITLSQVALPSENMRQTLVIVAVDWERARIPRVSLEESVKVMVIFVTGLPGMS